MKSILCFASKGINGYAKASASRHYRKKDYDTSKRNEDLNYVEKNEKFGCQKLTDTLNIEKIR